MRVDYTDHLPDEFRMPAIQLYVRGLKEKLMPVLGKAEQAQRVLAKNIAPDQCLVAFYDQKPVGLLSIQNQEKSLWNPTLKLLIEEYGLIGGIYRLAGLQLLHHKTNIGEWYVDGIVVTEEMRGLGIGSGLLSLLEKMARNKGIGLLSLEVIDTNPRAKLLYERHGFVENARKSIRPFHLIYGFPFRSAVVMVKTLSSNAPGRQRMV
jgi:ribosomal protein S18 acetylase RimI-like enzyme